MSVIISKYDNNIDECWYNSSNIIYSKMIDNKDSYKDVYVTFKDGRTYHYKNVTIQDYLLFKGCESQGKALYKYLAQKSPLTKKLKYESNRVEDAELKIINETKERLIVEQNNILDKQNNG